MFNYRKLVAALALATLCGLASAGQYAGIGRPATSPEVAAWDIDVRPDFKGLPAGAGSVSQGQAVFEQKCAGCHGDFGESTLMFSPLIGGTTTEDSKSGRVASLALGSILERTTFAKAATLSTLFDYVRRAMPWNAPKSLSNDEVYAVLAYLLNLAYVVPDDFTLSQATMAATQQKMPNRLGITQDHAMWPGTQVKPDTTAIRCMQNCRKDAAPSSELPAAAQSTQGNQSLQNRSFGPVRGTSTPTQ